MSAADAELCKPDTLDATKVAGAVVLCKRGDNDRIDKSHNVLLAGGVGMILYNVSDAQELVTDTHWVPSVHVSFTDGTRVKALIARGTTAELTAGSATGLPRGGILAAFSSRGPQTAVPDIPKPDVTAPGVNILAAAAPEPAVSSGLKPGEVFQSISGTSMASPHVAGAAALLTQLHPLFTPAELKSSLMTSANPDVLKEDGVTDANAFDKGSGEIDPNKAADPGLVLDTTTDEYIRYLEGQDPDLVIGSPTPIAATDLNIASISNAKVPGAITTSRTLEAVTQVATRWDVRLEGLPGFTATFSPRSFTLKPGSEQTIGMTFRRTTATLDEYSFGAVVIEGGGRTVRLPVSLKPIALKAPDTITVNTTAASGSRAFTVQTGFAGPLTAQGFGLAVPQLNAGKHISATTGNPNLSGTDPGTQLYPVTVPAGSQLFASRLSNVDGGDPNTDLDLYVYLDPNGDGNYADAQLVDASASGSSDERVTIPFPDAGKYVVAVVGFTTSVPDSVYDVTNWVATDAQPDNPAPAPGITVTGDPVNATNGANVPLTLNWSDVAALGTYLGVVTYHQGATPSDANEIGMSVVELNRTGTPSPGGAPASTPGAAPSAGGTSPAATGGVLGAQAGFALGLRSAKVSGRTLVLRLRSIGRPALRVVVMRGSRTVARGAARAVKDGARTVRVHLNRRLAHGRYTVRVTGVADGYRTARTVAVRVR